ncbi:MAG: quinol:cytochrome C oxidoreductase, partial [Flavobacteriia bacterium]|nr:quinol:cytochrome C oxidoreductase [Flavobacteriia bacterium]
MFEFSNKAKRFSWILMAIGAVALVMNFTTNDAAHGHADDHGTEMHAEEAHGSDHGAHAEEAHDGHGEEADAESHGEHAAMHAEAGHDHAEEHAHHSPAANKPWSRLFHNSFFFMAIALGSLFFLAIQYAAQAGWSVTSLRIMEAIATFLPIPLIVMIIIAGLGVGHVHHMWHWMAEGITEEGSATYDSIIAGKAGYLNGPFFMARLVAYLIVWVLFARILRSLSRRSDEAANSDEKWAVWRKSRNM